MAKAKKNKSEKKPSVKVQDLNPEKDPKGGITTTRVNKIS
jgi:hypothetical protein